METQPNHPSSTAGITLLEAPDAHHSEGHSGSNPGSHTLETTLVESPVGETEEIEGRTKLPWYKRPSPIWILVILPITTIAFSACAAPRIAIYTQLVCEVHKPELRRSGLPADAFLLSNSSEPNKCAEDGVVGAEVAKLNLVIATSMGILSCLTTAWWGSFSDRHGRTKVLGISVIGLLINDVNFIQVLYNFRILPGGYWFLMVGPVIEGCLGGMTTAVAATHAYLADTSTSDARSRVLSLSLGLLFIGIAIGPAFGSLVIGSTGSIISVFYVAAFIHFLYALVTWFVLPDSVPESRRHASKIKYQEERDQAGAASQTRRIFGFLSPLSIFSPNVTRQTTKGRDWNLAFLAIGYGFTISIMGSYSYKFQYAAKVFHWTPVTIGYWLSLVSITRAVYLTLILPVIIKIFKQPAKSPRQTRTASETEPLLPPSSNSIATHASTFDLGLARASLLVEIVTYALMGLVIHPGLFTGLSMLSAVGTGFSPAVQSVALELYTQNGGTESGRLFGALSVVQSISSQIVGPALYGLVYMKTLDVFPRAIFFVSVGTVTISLVLILLIRLPSVPADLESITRRQHNVSATLVDDQVATKAATLSSSRPEQSTSTQF